MQKEKARERLIRLGIHPPEHNDSCIAMSLYLPVESDDPVKKQTFQARLRQMRELQDMFVGKRVKRRTCSVSGTVQSLTWGASPFGSGVYLMVQWDLGRLGKISPGSVRLIKRKTEPSIVHVQRV